MWKSVRKRLRKCWNFCKLTCRILFASDTCSKLSYIYLSAGGLCFSNNVGTYVPNMCTYAPKVLIYSLFSTYIINIDIITF